MCRDADHLHILHDLDAVQHATVERCTAAMRELAEALRWMLAVAEARNCDPRSRTVTLKFTRHTLMMWQEKAQRALAHVDSAS